MRYLREVASTKASFRFSPLLLAAVLAPAFVQTQYTCNSGDTRLASLEVEVSGVNRVVFDPALRVYDLWLPGGETQATVRAVPMDPLARVTWYVPDGAGMLASGTIGLGGGEVHIDLPPDGYALYIGVLPPERAVDTYIVNMNPVCPHGDVCANGGLSGRCVSGVCVPDAFPCTEQGIRNAIATGGGPHTFECDGPTIVPTETEIVIDNDVVLDGEGNFIADAGGTHRVFSVPEGATAQLTGFTLTGGSTDEAGGGILNAGRLQLANSVVSENTARFGGGVRNEDQGRADVIDTTVSNNVATQAGGGISNRLDGASMTIVGSTVVGNVAEDGCCGGIGNSGTLMIDNTSVSDNEATTRGGGISNASDSTLTMSYTTVTSNRAGWRGGGVSNLGACSSSDSTISGNSATIVGGGVFNREASFTLTNSTVAGNRADGGGGGIYSEAANLRVTGSELSANTALDSHGGGILNTGGAWATVQDTVVSLNGAFNGGGISNDNIDTSLVLVRVEVQGNTAANDGGGINNGGTLQLVDSAVEANSANNYGGGIQSFSGATELIRTSVSGNQSFIGGGLSNFPDAEATLFASTVAGNATTNRGGGIDNQSYLALTNTRIASNSAGADGGGILNSGTLIATRSTISENTAASSGGGIENYSGWIDLDSSTVSANVSLAGGGGGIENPFPDGTLRLANATVSGNSSVGRGAIENAGTAVVTASTLSLGVDDGTVLWDGACLLSPSCPPGALTIIDTIIDGHCMGAPAVSSLGGNIESHGNTCGLGHPTDQVFVPAPSLNLQPLADNGGPTQTHALLPGSAAVDSAIECVNAAGFPLLVDQRGAARPSGPACDSGAFELGGVLQPVAQCVNDADRAVYGTLEFVDGNAIVSTCTGAADAIASDCVFGSALSSPPLPGCLNEATDVLSCHPNCPQDVIDALDQCVASCTAGATGLSAACANCYGAWAGCGAQSCVPECSADVGSPLCLDCLEAAGCTAIFDACSGLSADVDCGASSFEYTQDFESLNQASASALSADGWIIWAQVIDGNGDFKFAYGPFPAPNGTGSFSAIVTGEGGPDQGAQQLVTYSDYNCCDPPNQGHFNGTDQVVSLVHQTPFTTGRVIAMEHVGATFEFSFDAKRGGITGGSTAEGFIQTNDPNNEFAQTHFVSVDTTNIPVGTWERYSISLAITPDLVGQHLNFGFLTAASNFELSDVFYDNIVAELEAP